MKIAHLADLHLGKVVNNYSLIEDQREILNQIAEKLKRKEVSAVLIAGDIYDRPVPTQEAVKLLNDFLMDLAKAEIDVFLIAGNHDNGERLQFARELLDEMRIHITGTWMGKLSCVDLVDRDGIIHVYSLPFIKPSIVNSYIEDTNIRVTSYTEAVRYALNTVQLNPNERNILLAHQFVDGAVVSDNGPEVFNVGDEDHVDPSVFEGFDYVALGHIHTAQAVGNAMIRYAGSPMKYSFNEGQKSFTLLNIEQKQTYRLSMISLTPVKTFEEIRGTFKQIVDPSMVEAHHNNYIKIILEDENDIPDAALTLKAYYPFLMQLEYESAKTKSDRVQTAAHQMETTTPLELFSQFYELRNGTAMSEEQTEYMQNLIAEVWKGDQE